MRKIFPFYIFCLLLMNAAHARGADRILHVIPAPKKVVWREGVFVWDAGVYIVTTNPADETQRLAADQIREEARRDMGLDIPVRKVVDPRGLGKPVILGMPAMDSAARAAVIRHGIVLSDLMIPEGYALSVGRDSIVIAGTDADGLFWGAQTLKLIMRADSDGRSIPKLRIDDWPAFHFRGVEEDVSRGPVPNMATVKLNIERLSELKINKFMFYMEHVFCYQKHPDIGPKGGCFTAGEIREIGEFARRHRVEFIGALQSFGHMKNILTMPRYNPLAEQPEKPEVLSPANPGTYSLLADMYSEYAPLFDSKLFNMECDETGGLGDGQSRKMAEQIGVEGVYAYHVNKIHDMLSRYGKRPMMWADIALEKPKIIPMLPADIIFLPWEYHAQVSYEKWVKPLAEAHRDFIVSAGVTNWSRIFPDIETALLNVKQFSLDGARYNAMGQLNSSYNDDGENLFGYNWFSLAFGADAAWDPFGASADSFRKNFGAVFYGEREGRMDRAIKLLGDSFANMEMEYLFDVSFMTWPPKIVIPKRTVAMSEAKRAKADMERALKLIAEARPAARYNADNPDFIAFAARRERSVALHKIAYLSCLNAFDAAARKPEDRAAVLKDFDIMESAVDSVSNDTQRILDEYRRLWMIENRPYYFDVVADKYKDFIQKVVQTRRAIAAAKESYLKTGRLPKDEKELGL